MKGQSVTSYEAERLILMLEAVINQHKTPTGARLFDWGSVYRTAAFHHVTNILYYSVLAIEPNIPKLWEEKFAQKYRLATTNEPILKNVVEAVLWSFEQNKNHILLTGSYSFVPYYPKTEMGELSRAEFVIEKEKKEAVRQLMERMHFEPIKTKRGVFGYKRDNIKLYFREGWSDSNKWVKNYFRSPFTRLPKKKGFSFVHEFYNEDAYLRQVANIAESFIQERPRLRDLVDLWVFYTAHYRTLDFEYLESSLAKMRLDNFEHKLIALLNSWFGRFQILEDELTNQKLFQFILSGGAECTQIASQLLPYKRKQEEEYLLAHPSDRKEKWMFPDFKYMKMLFPVLERLPILLPFCWIARLLRLQKCKMKLWLQNFREKQEQKKQEKIHQENSPI